MQIGVLKEIKIQEHRVGLTPAGVRELCTDGHQIWIQRAAGAAIGFSDEDYQHAGAQIAEDAATVFTNAELIIKVKEPQPSEIQQLTDRHSLFTYLHLAPDRPLTEGLQDSGATCIAYETVTDDQGDLPLLAPMSEVAGRMAIQVGAQALLIHEGGLGILPAGVPGVSPANIVIIGGGVVGANAARMAMGIGADVTVLDNDLAKLQQLDLQFGPRLKTLYAHAETIDTVVQYADMLIGAVLLPGATAPKIIERHHLALMRTGTVLVDVSIDQGGCFASSHPTTHEQPTYIEQGIVHYCVANMPGAVARTSTLALTNATLPFIRKLAGQGIKAALLDDRHLLSGLNISQGQITHQAVASAQSQSFTDPFSILGST
ncbi:alanine dehydrogenase [Methylophaga nitratireducenticrescens]|uniref:alanine dehydrogenase n=1 Tax=Methylophaga nitratireducenticrescens TaxID=754476 RepID=UPI000CDCBF39|nr:alanine dehydrogenase [Methylophaga nitratireducenticrescens]AUZ84480.1 alanine dehydrogenase [Methylophaga nitratireducenticrescens]